MDELTAEETKGNGNERAFRPLNVTATAGSAVSPLPELSSPYPFIENKENLRVVETTTIDGQNNEGIPPSWQESKSKKYKWSAPLENKAVRISGVWRHFEIFEYRNSTACEETGVKVVRCNFPKCHAELSYNGSSTKGMLDHLRKCHKDEADVERLAQRSKRTAEKAGDGQPELSPKEAKVNKTEIGVIKAGMRAADAELDKALVEALVSAAVPFSVLDNEKVKRFFDLAVPGYQPPSRRTLACTKLSAQILCMEAERKKFFETVGPFSIAVDEWSSPSEGRSLIAVKGHGWSENFQRYQVTLGLVPFWDIPHNAASIAKIIVAVLEDCKLKLENVTCMVSDGASVMKKTCSDLQLDWIHCLAHAIQLVANQVLTVQRLKDLVLRARSNATAIGGSNNLGLLLIEMQKAAGVPVKRLRLDCRTRWDSTLVMLRSAVENAAATNAMVDWMVRNKKGGRGCALQTFTEESISEAQDAIRVLSLIEEITKLASSNEETVSSYLPSVMGLMNALKEKRKDKRNTTFVNELLDVALAEVTKRFFQAFPLKETVTVKKACFMDPRYAYHSELYDEKEWEKIKEDIQDEGIRKMDGANVGNARPSGSASALNSSQEDSRALSDRINDEAKSLSSKTSTATSVVKCTSLLTFFQAERGGSPQKDRSALEKMLVQQELIVYRTLLYSFRSNEDYYSINSVSQFWRDHRFQMPILYMLARTYLSPTLGSVEVERLFSSVTNLLSNKKRNGISNKKMVDLLMLREFYTKEVQYFKPTSFVSYKEEDHFDDAWTCDSENLDYDCNEYVTDITE